MTLDNTSNTTSVARSEFFLTLFALYYTLARFVTDLGGKTRVMDLMTHEDPDVRYRALISVQQLVSQPWVIA